MEKTTASKNAGMTYFEVKLDTGNILAFYPEPIKTIYPN